MKKSTLFSILTIFLLVPATLLLGRHIKGRWYYLTSTLVIIEIMLPFFASFESRKPQSRELVTLAVMAALATASRVAFVFIPYFKAITGVIMITGIAFGAQAGFLTGAIAAFASNFFFSQGPWTPWQMFAYGFAGFWAGLIFHGRQKWCKPWILGIFGFLSILLLVGPAGLLHRVYGAQQAYLEKCALYLRPGCPCQYRPWHWLRRDADGADEAPAV